MKLPAKLPRLLTALTTAKSNNGSKSLAQPLWLWMPKLAGIMLLFAILGLLWISKQNELEDQRQTLISDVLWLEQTLRFQLQGDTSQLAVLTSEMSAVLGQPEQLLEQRQPQVIKLHPELVYSELATPTALGRAAQRTKQAESALIQAQEIAAKLHRPQFTEPFVDEEGHSKIYVLTHAQDKRKVSLLAEISLDALLQDAVPWWFAQKYQVRLLSSSGQELARKSNLDPEDFPINSSAFPPLNAYQLLLDPPGFGLTLAVTAYHTSAPSAAQRFITILILLLAVAVIGSLWIIREQMQQRARTEDLARQQAEKLQTTARLITTGEMASTLAHELNQPLAAITGYASGCLHMLATPNLSAEQLEGVKQALAKLGIQAQRAGKIVHRVHNFVKKRESHMSSCDLQTIIEDSVAFCEDTARKFQAQISVAIPHTLRPVEADQVMMEQVLINLIKNALESMHSTPVSERVVSVVVEQESDYARIRVSDKGCGIPDENQGKLFNAFFTTKNEGVGVGLSICRSIIELHKGQLYLEPQPEGSQFVLTIPWST